MDDGPDGDADADRGTDEPDAGAGGTDDPLAWADLFERAAAYRTGETTIREALDRRRRGTDD